MFRYAVLIAPATAGVLAAASAHALAAALAGERR